MLFPNGKRRKLSRSISLIHSASTWFLTHAFLQRLKFRIRILKFGLRFLNFLFAVYTLTTMCVTLSVYLRTNKIRRTLYLPPTPITRGPWHADSKSWSTYVLLVTSIVSCLFTSIVVLLYLHSVKAANKANLWYSQMVYALFAAHVAVWIGTAVAYRTGKDGTDLWGWSCTSDAQKVLQLFFRDVVDFKLLCTIQVCASKELMELLISAKLFSTDPIAFRPLRGR